MNGKTDIDSEQYETGCNFVIGGNTLGRGVTFPGLQTIYYTRTSKKPQADTMWQHSRMFGYDRDPGLMRVYIDENLYKLFSDINATNNSIISQIERGIEQELEQCIDFARRSAPTQQDIEFGQHDVVPRSVDEVSRDTIIGKIAEVAFAKIMHENYGIDIELDFEVYPRGQYDAQDAVVNDWRIDVKGTRQGGHYLLVEWNKLDFRQQEKRLSHVYVMFSVGWDRERDLPNRYVKYAGAITLRALNNNNDWIDTKILRKGECIPGTNARLQADNYGIEFNELNKNLDGLVHTMQNRKPNQNVVDYYLNPYTNDTTIEITRSEEAKRLHIERVKAILSEWERNHQS